MLKLFRFEMMKLHKTASLWVCLGIFILLVCISNGANHWMLNGGAESFLDNALGNIEIDVDTILEGMTEEEREAWYANDSENEQFNSERDQFKAEHDINSNYGVPSFIVTAFSSSSFMMILMAVVIAMLIAKEYQDGTIKMSLISAHRREQIAGAKILTVASVILEFLLAAAIASYIMGIIIATANGGNIEPFGSNHMISRGGVSDYVSAFGYVVTSFFVGYLEIFMYAMFTLLISFVTKSVVMSILIPIAVSMVASIVSSFGSLSENIVYSNLFFSLQGNISLWDAYSTSTRPLYAAVIATALWTIALAGGAVYVFKKQDIYN